MTTASASLFIQPLFDGPLDVVGDVHGEIDALDDLLRHLGYVDGVHPDGRRLVFVGDLVDRGPDSPAVLRMVRELCAAGLAQCVAGNHELNLVRHDAKDDNYWFLQPQRRSRYPQARISADEKQAMLKFLDALPLVLERDGLRIVHACWNRESVEDIRSLGDPGCGLADLYQRYQHAFNQRMLENKMLSYVKREWRDFAPRLQDPDWDAVLMPLKAQLDERNQMENPVAVLTSGEEQVADAPFFVGGKWRMCTRVRWWEDYTDDAVVIIGHYWRRFDEARAVIGDSHGPDLFAGIEPHHWMGPGQNVYCVDFSVGGRPRLRARDHDERVCRLAAVRVPEWQVVHDDGERANIE